MTYPLDDPAQMFVPPNEEHPPVFAIGILEEWNPTTFRGTVRYRGALLRDRPVINRVEALSFVVGQQVSLLGRSGTGAMTSFAILGSFLTPGTTAAEEAIAFFQSDLARQISAEIFTDRIVAADTAGPDVADTGTFEDLGGPEVEVEISEIGRAVVFLSGAANSQDSLSNAVDVGARMSFEITGATTQAASTSRSVAFLVQVAHGSENLFLNVTQRQGTAVLVEGLNPGTHTFRALYATLFAGRDVTFTDRTIIVIGF